MDLRGAEICENVTARGDDPIGLDQEGLHAIGVHARTDLHQSN